MSSSINKVFLVTDFGYKDYYVAAMKTVILDFCPNIHLIDVSHQVNPGDILEGSFICWQLSLLSIKNSGVLCVVDPGVGTDRDAIVIFCENNNVLVGPDNGVLYPLAMALGIKQIYKIDISNKNFFPKVSKTFHGRDVFARALGYLCKGYTEFLLAKETIIKNDIFIYSKVKGRILTKAIHIDNFGNIITNVPCLESLPSKLVVRVRDRSYPLKRVEVFNDLSDNELGIICGSSGLYEIVCNRCSAAVILGCRVGDTLELKYL